MIKMARIIKLWPILILWLALEFIILGPYSYMEYYAMMGWHIPRLMGNLDARWMPLLVTGLDQWLNYSYFGWNELLARILPAWLVYQIDVLTQITVGVVGTYLLCRKNIGAPIYSAGIAAAFHGVLLTEGLLYNAPLAYLPAMILIYNYMAQADKILNWVGFLAIGAGFGFIVQTWDLPFAIAAIVITDWALSPSLSFKRIAQAALFTLAALLADAPQIYALVNQVSETQRAELTLPSSILSGLIEYAGAFWNKAFWEFEKTKWVLWLLIGLGLFSKSLRYEPFRKALRVLGAFLCLNLASALTWCVLSQYSTMIQSLHLPRVYFYIPFFLVLPAALSLPVLNDLLARKIDRQRAQNLTVALLSGFIILQSLSLKRAHFFLWLEQGNYANRLNDPRLKDLARHSPDHLFRVITLREDPYLLPQYASAYGLESLDGSVHIGFRRFSEFWPSLFKNETESSAGPKGEMMHFRSRSALVDFNNYYRLQLLQLTNVRYIIAHSKINDPLVHPLLAAVPDLTAGKGILEKIKRNLSNQSDIQIYELPNPWPRFFLANRVKIFSDKQNLLNALKEEPLENKTAFLNEQEIGGGSKFADLGFTQESLEILEYREDSITLAMKTNGPAVLVGTNSYSAGWKAEIDGKKASIFPAFHAFWGLHVPAGDHKINFKYQP